MNEKVFWCLVFQCLVLCHFCECSFRVFLCSFAVQNLRAIVRVLTLPGGARVEGVPQAVADEVQGKERQREKEAGVN